MTDDKIVVPPDVEAKLRAAIKKREPDYEIVKDALGAFTIDSYDRHDLFHTIFSSEEDALERLKKAWVKEEQLKSEWLFCPHCDKRLNIAKNLDAEHKEAVARLRDIMYFVESTLDHTIKYEIKKGTWATSRMTPDGIAQMKHTLKELQERLRKKTHGTTNRGYYIFPEKRVLLKALGEKEK